MAKMGAGVDGLSRFRRFFTGSKRRSELASEMRKKVQRQLVLLRGDILRYIDSEAHGVPNSPLTVLAKGSSRPLVDRGDLRRSINWRTETKVGTLWGGVGVLRTRKTRDGRSLVNVAIPLHEGFTVRVTPKVRAAVFAEMRKRRGKAVRFESSEGSRTWKVKGRPFVRVPFEDAHDRIVEALGDGVKLSFHKD